MPRGVYDRSKMKKAKTEKVVKPRVTSPARPSKTEHVTSDSALLAYVPVALATVDTIKEKAARREIASRIFQQLLPGSNDLGKAAETAVTATDLLLLELNRAKEPALVQTAMVEKADGSVESTYERNN